MRHRILALLIAPAVIAAVQAVAAGSMPVHPKDQAAAACEAARLAAWFDAQRQLTDGNVDPTKPIPKPEECIRPDAHAGAAPHPGTAADYRAGALPAHPEQEREPMPRG